MAVRRPRQWRHRRELRLANQFGRFVHVLWRPDELPSSARCYWPNKTDWPTTSEVRTFIRETRKKPEVRLAVLTGLRRYSEPGSSQMLMAIGSVIVSIVAVALTVSGLNTQLHFIIVYAGSAYILLALFGIALAIQMDERRKMANAWLRALEDALP